RVMIAMAMVMKPALLVADEPTTALDVTIQAQILDLMRELIAETHTSLVLVTHDMGVVAEMANRVLVMRDGRAVEQAPTRSLFAAPRQAYTRALLAAVPRLDGAPAAEPPTTDHRRTLLAVDSISKTFGSSGKLSATRTEPRALDAVSIDVAAGETVALVGEDRKSTRLNSSHT